jgi:hypothetical protein
LHDIIRKQIALFFAEPLTQPTRARLRANAMANRSMPPRITVNQYERLESCELVTRFG